MLQQARLCSSVARASPKMASQSRSMRAESLESVSTSLSWKRASPREPRTISTMAKYSGLL
jgi:hypothetical protein